MSDVATPTVGQQLALLELAEGLAAARDFARRVAAGKYATRPAGLTRAATRLDTHLARRANHAHALLTSVEMNRRSFG